jgi:hypothetical protein
MLDGIGAIAIANNVFNATMPSVRTIPIVFKINLFITYLCICRAYCKQEYGHQQSLLPLLLCQSELTHHIAHKQMHLSSYSPQYSHSTHCEQVSSEQVSHSLVDTKLWISHSPIAVSSSSMSIKSNIVFLSFNTRIMADGSDITQPQSPICPILLM